MGESKGTILIVDDEQVNLLSLVKILEDKYDLKLAKNGEQAIAIAQKTLPDLILLDVMMPGMDGFEVISKIKTIDEIAHIPIIFITGLNSAENEEKGFLLGAVDYVTKPFKPIVVKARIGTHMRIIRQLQLNEKMGMQDGLTEIANRRYFDIQLSREWNRAIREKIPISFLAMDIDEFKKYNDTYGHLQGDTMLKAVAKTIERAAKRSSDFTARIGGEEFGLLLPNTAKEGAVVVAEQIRLLVEEMQVPCTTGEITKATLSIGVTCSIPKENELFIDFIEHADKNLYAAKAQGRNRVVS